MRKHQLAEAFITTQAFKEDPHGFVLASGARSRFYVDCRSLLAYPGPRRLVAELGFAALQHESFDCIGGLEIGAIPIATVISDTAYRNTPSFEWRTFVVRKEPKGHGLGKVIEGAVEAGDRAVVVDDVLTSGGSILKAVSAARAAGLTVSHALVIVDRNEQDGRDRLKAEGITLLSLLTIEDLQGVRDQR